MSFNGWGKSVNIDEDINISSAGIIFKNRTYNQVTMYDADENLGIMHFGKGDFQLDSRTGTDTNTRTLLRVRSGGATNENIADAVLLTKLGGNDAGTYRMYGEHNWGKGLTGFAGVDNNATTNTQYAGYYKFATIGQRANNYSRTSAMFFLLGEDVQYRPTFLYVTSRLNVPTTTTSGYNLMQITTYTNSFGGDTVDTNLASRIYICANKPTSVTNNVNVDLYWYQDTSYNSLRYYLLYGSYRNSNNKLDMSKITLHHTASPTTLPTTTSTPSYDYVWKLSDNLNKILNVQY